MSIDVTRLMATQKSISGNPFDFQYWRTWLSQRAEELQNAGFDAQHSVNNLGPKPSSGVSAKNGHQGEYFSNWVTGETDFQVLDFASGESIVNKMGLIVDDSTFAQTFDEFVNALRVPAGDGTK
jgi:hypothetical protein